MGLRESWQRFLVLVSSVRVLPQGRPGVTLRGQHPKRSHPREVGTWFEKEEEGFRGTIFRLFRPGHRHSASRPQEPIHSHNAATRIRESAASR